MNIDELEAIRARVEAATPGPWMVDGASRDAIDLIAENGTDIARVERSYAPATPSDSQDAWANARLIANAPSDIGALISEVNRLHDELCRTRLSRTGLAIDFKAMRERSFRDEALRHLASIEWSASTRESVPYCLFCFQTEAKSHAADCAVFGCTGILRPSMRAEES